MRAKRERSQCAQPAQDDLSRRLRAESEAYEPDQQLIWARVEAAMGRPAGTGRGRARTRAYDRRPVPMRALTASLASAAAVAVVSGLVWQVTGGDGGRDQSVRPAAHRTAAPTARPSASGTRTPGDKLVSHSAAPKASPTPSAPVRPPAGGDADRPFVVAASIDAGSNAHWAQNNLTLRVRRTLRELTVTIKVDRSERVATTGSWLSLRPGDFDISTKATENVVTYRWTLRAGRTVPPGDHVLAAQYNRTADHDFRKDTYTVRVLVDGEGDHNTAEGRF
jgi:hypothetical protein